MVDVRPFGRLIILPNSAKNGVLINVLINGFNRGGLTCDVDGLRGFIPRSQLEEGKDHQSLVGKTLKVAFLEVNPESRKLVLSEKKASLVSKFANLKLGQLIEGEVLAVKPYGFFVDLGGASGLLHQSSWPWTVICRCVTVAATTAG